MFVTVHEPSGEYLDTLSIGLYTGAFSDPGTHVLADTVDVDGSGATDPFLEHVLGGARLPYTLSYGGSPVAPWSGGAGIVTDSGSTTAPEWLTKDLRISYTGTTALVAGDYEDRLIVTISAK